MPQLFQIPKPTVLSGLAILPGAKVYYYATGTTTPQNTYQDIDLTIPHANPVVADGAGLLPVIYLDGSLGDYRVRIETSAGGLVYQVDDIPSGNNSAQFFRLSSNAPEIVFEEQDAASDNKKWRIRVNAQVLTIDLGNDAESIWTNILTVERTGTAAGDVTVNNLTVTNDLLVEGSSSSEDGDSVATQTSGTFPATLTGMSGATTGDVIYSKTGNKVTLFFASNIAGTSNSNAMTMTGLPTAIKPPALSVSRSVPCIVTDNGAAAMGTASISNSQITFSVGYGVATTFTSSGTKGLPQGSSFTYDIQTVATP